MSGTVGPLYEGDSLVLSCEVRGGKTFYIKNQNLLPIRHHEGTACQYVWEFRAFQLNKTFCRQYVLNGKGFWKTKFEKKKNRIYNLHGKIIAAKRKIHGLLDLNLHHQFKYLHLNSLCSVFCHRNEYTMCQSVGKKEKRI